jgi:cyanophycinase
MSGRQRAAGLILLALVGGVEGAAQEPRATHRVVRGLWPLLVGNPADVQRPTRPILVLAGGGADVDAAMQALGEGAGAGDLVVLRATGGGGYNQYLLDLTGADSVETLIVAARRRAEDPYVLARVGQAEGVFLAGGDQADYVTFWGGTALTTTIDGVVARGAPLGGTSAGLAILGEWVFAALAGTITSSQALANPYHERVTLVRNVLHVPALAGVICDSHFAGRDRMGRLVTFLARLVADFGVQPARGLGIDEATALVVDENGLGTVVGRGAVYLLQSPGPPQRCLPGQGLTFRQVAVQRAVAGQAVHLPSWQGTGLASYTVTAEDGQLTSTQPGGRLY